MSRRKKTEKLRQHVRRLALDYPEAHEEFPWGERVIKVRKKVFVFLCADDAVDFSMSVKLPDSNARALSFPGSEPTGYGLGKSGWVSVRFGTPDDPPLELIEEWIDESYRAIAPKKLLAELADEP